LWAIDFDPDSLEFFPLPCNEKDSAKKADLCQHWPEPEQLIDSVEFTITGFEWSPDGKMIAFNHHPDPLINTFFKSNISILYVETKKIVPLVQKTRSLLRILMKISHGLPGQRMGSMLWHSRKLYVTFSI
jgi:hypothetical protein